jgi:site-specific DNA recombinase
VGQAGEVRDLLDLDDVAAGNVTRMRWREPDKWITPEHKTHEALISDETWQVVQARIAATVGVTKRPGQRHPRQSSHPLPTRGQGHVRGVRAAMQGQWRAMKSDPEGRTLYRCEFGKGRALPLELAHHPRAVYVNQADLVARIDHELGALFTDPVAMAEALNPSTNVPPEVLTIRRDLAKVEESLTNLVDVVMSELVFDAMTAAIVTKEAERAVLRTRLAALAQPA